MKQIMVIKRTKNSKRMLQLFHRNPHSKLHETRIVKKLKKKIHIVKTVPQSKGKHVFSWIRNIVDPLK
jgi:hypothetical protein